MTRFLSWTYCILVHCRFLQPIDRYIHTETLDLQSANITQHRSLLCGWLCRLYTDEPGADVTAENQHDASEEEAIADMLQFRSGSLCSVCSICEVKAQVLTWHSTIPRHCLLESLAQSKGVEHNCPLSVCFSWQHCSSDCDKCPCEEGDEADHCEHCQVSIFSPQMLFIIHVIMSRASSC